RCWHWLRSVGKMAGAEVVACASSDPKIARLKELGADHCINYKAQSFLDGVKEIYGKPRLDGSGGVNVAVNFTGGDTMKETQRCVALHGRILTCGATAGYDLNIDARFWWSYEHQMLGSNGWMPEDLTRLLSLIAEGKFNPVIDKVLPLEETSEAERILEDREVVGKVLVKP
ncbi:MAG: zinc-binding dehydrogenase, partial [Pseudomonadota bacterium]